MTVSFCDLRAESRWWCRMPHSSRKQIRSGGAECQKTISCEFASDSIFLVVLCVFVWSRLCAVSCECHTIKQRQLLVNMCGWQSALTVCDFFVLQDVKMKLPALTYSNTSVCLPPTSVQETEFVLYCRMWEWCCQRLCAPTFCYDLQIFWILHTST